MCVCRVVTPNASQEVAGHHFVGFGAHHCDYPCSYLTAAAAVGITKQDVDGFIRRLDSVLSKRRGRPSAESQSTPACDLKPEVCRCNDTSTDGAGLELDVLRSTPSIGPTVDDSAGSDEGVSTPPLMSDDSHLRLGEITAHPLNESVHQGVHSSAS